MSEELKTKRRYKKAAFSRLTNALSRTAVDDDLDKLSRVKGQGQSCILRICELP